MTKKKIFNQKDEGDIIYGMHPISEVIQAKKRKIYEVYGTESKLHELGHLLKKLPSYTKIISLDRSKIEHLTKTPDHQSIAARVAPFLYKKDFFHPAQCPVVLVCDGVQDTKNMGALLRSAYCTNIMGIVIPEKSTVSITAAALKSSAGLAEYLEVYQAKTIKSALEEAKKAGYHIYLAAAKGKHISDMSFKTPCCIVIGNEHEGIHPSLFSYGEIISLKQKTPTISYNASVAGGILLYRIAEELSLF
jgi:23S rRNA (guanosine2251-2'-O)-methyltransferase